MGLGFRFTIWGLGHAHLTSNGNLGLWEHMAFRRNRLLLIKEWRNGKDTEHHHILCAATADTASESSKAVSVEASFRDSFLPHVLVEFSRVAGI